jgi:drug/metabolite transporter (DMT)-like permease
MERIVALRTSNWDKSTALLRNLFAHQIDLLLVGMVFVWGANFTILKIALRSINPLAFNALRFLIATAVLMAILRWQRQSLRIARADLGRVILIGIIGHGIYQVFFIEGLARTLTANASLLMATVPIIVAVVSAALGMERVAPHRWFGIILSFAGILLVTVGSGRQMQFGASHLIGDLLILGAAVMWAAYTVLSKPLLARYSPLHLTAVTMIPGTAVLVLISLPTLWAQSWSTVQPAAWAGLGYSAVFSIALAYLVWFTGVQRVGNARTSIYSNLTPVIASFLSWAVLREPFGLLQAAGGAVILTGLLLARRNPRR